MLRQTVCAGLAGLGLTFFGGSTLAQSPWPGVSAQIPRGMVETDTWTRDCPASCKMYEGPDDEEWPLIILHQPVLAAPKEALAQHRDGLAKKTGNTVTILMQQSGQQDGMDLSMGVFETRDSWEDPGEGEFSMIAFLGKDGVTFPVELKSLNKSDLDNRKNEFISTVNSVRIDSAVAKAAVSGADRDLKAMADAIAAGYARGEQAVIYNDVSAGVRNEFRVGGLQLIAYREETRIVLLPGGVLIDDDNEDVDFRKPDLALLRAESMLGSWKKVGANYEVIDGKGKKLTYRPGPRDGRQTSLTADGDPVLRETARMTAADMVGSYATIDTNTSGGGSSELAMVASRSDKKLVLKADGRFEMTREGFVGVLGSNVTVGVPTGEVVRGRFNWDPASWMITLTPDQGPVIRGPMYPGPGQFEMSEIRTGGDWTVLGGSRWWREKP